MLYQLNPCSCSTITVVTVPKPPPRLLLLLISSSFFLSSFLNPSASFPPLKTTYTSQVSLSLSLSHIQATSTSVLPSLKSLATYLYFSEAYFDELPTDSHKYNFNGKGEPPRRLLRLGNRPDVFKDFTNNLDLNKAGVWVQASLKTISSGHKFVSSWLF